MPALEATPGHASANTFASLAEYKDYLASRLHAASWVAEAVSGTSLDDALTIDLIVSCRILSVALIWTGSPTTPAVQALPWPRTGMYNINNYLIGSTIVPEALKNAQCELAYQLHNGDLFAQNTAADKNVRKVVAGAVEVEFQGMDLSSGEAVDIALHRLGPEFDYTRLPTMVRIHLVPSWYTRTRVGAVNAVFEVA